MKILKSHFWYNKSQRNGIFFFIVLIVLLQILIYNLRFLTVEKGYNDATELTFFKQQLDSLEKVHKKLAKPKVYPFNPNFITDSKGYFLGMSLQEIDRLHAYRKKGKFVNSVKEFKQVTKVHDTLLVKIAPYFKFPDWVVKKEKQKLVKHQPVIKKEPEKLIPKDINLATAADFQQIKGIGEKLANRIIKYRKRLQGYSIEGQLFEVWGLQKEVALRVLENFTIKEKPFIKKVNINEASFKEVLRLPYIDYNLCKELFNYRDEVAELQNISELKNIDNFPLDKYDRIILYLEVK